MKIRANGHDLEYKIKLSVALIKNVLYPLHNIPQQQIIRFNKLLLVMQVSFFY